MPAIPSDLINRLRSVLGCCDGLANDRVLRAIFIDARIKQWRNYVPENTQNRAERVTRVITTFCRLGGGGNENALVLLLRVLAESAPSGDMNRDMLFKLADALCEYSAEALATLAESANDVQP
ncbi:MAG: hypothetical protein JXA21_06405 [Anaerolineae bacterium]|nr:hypothetical protein [Anaerolineae bacterium]